MDFALHASLVTFALSVNGGTLDVAWQDVEAAVAEHGAPTNPDELRRVMDSLISHDDALAQVGG